MKRVLITGAGGYIGGSLAGYLKRFPEEYAVEGISLRDGAWRRRDFSAFDAVVHTAGIAHRKETAENAEEYYQVNRDLAIAVAEKAKAEGVGQFVFLSTMSVYGLEEGVVTPKTEPAPRSNYGKSKLQAEEALRAMASDSFHVAVLRPPMVYGDGCRGNYQMLVKLAKLAPVFPDYKNQRSMVHVDVLTRFIRELIEREISDGVFVPQDETYRCTCKMVQEIAAAEGKNLKLLRTLNPAVSLLKALSVKGKKAFGDLIYQENPE